MTSIKHAAFLFTASLFLPSCSGDPDSAQLASKTRAGENSAQSYYNRGVAAEKSGKYSRAKKDYDTIISKYPLSPVAGDSTYRFAKLLERDRDLLDAFDAYDAILTKYPASPHYAEAIKRQETIAHQAAQGHIKNSFIGIKSRVDVKKTTSMLRKVRDNAPRAASADRAQFTIAEVHQSRGSGSTAAVRAIASYQQLVRDYPNSKYASESQYRIGTILLAEAKQGNQDSANLDRAKRAFDDVLIRYPSSKRAKDAKAQIAKLSSGDIQRSFEVAEFYRKKGQTQSALFYYRETVNKSKPGTLSSKAQGWINKLTAQ
ncbi:MAG: outer membrane protein assembly factor BamD (BamD/ComL family) [Paracoccaceae bacterium]|jgi:outer membrane protein assembly factor BamD (BamD/ComL family)